MGTCTSDPSLTPTATPHPAPIHPPTIIFLERRLEPLFELIHKLLKVAACDVRKPNQLLPARQRTRSNHRDQGKVSGGIIGRQSAEGCTQLRRPHLYVFQSGAAAALLLLPPAAASSPPAPGALALPGVVAAAPAPPTPPAAR